MKNLITVYLDRTVDLNPFASLQFSNVTNVILTNLLNSQLCSQVAIKVAVDSVLVCAIVACTLFNCFYKANKVID